MFLKLVLEQYKLIISQKEVSWIRRKGTLRRELKVILKDDIGKTIDKEKELKNDPFSLAQICVCERNLHWKGNCPARRTG